MAALYHVSLLPDFFAGSCSEIVVFALRVPSFLNEVAGPLR